MKREELLAQYLAINQAIYKSWKDKFHTAVANDKLTPALIAVLFAVEDMQPVAGRDIVARLGVTKGAVAQFIESLESLGYISKQTDAYDRRVSILTVSQSGTRKLKELHQSRNKLTAYVTSSLSDMELRQAIDIHQKILKALEQ